MADKNASSNTADVRARNLEIAISQIEKEFGKGTIMRLGDTGTAIGDVPVISTGSLALDLALGVGGLPAGRIIEIYGPESSGKTTLCLHVIANSQAAGGRCAIIDAEHAIDPGYAEKIGVKIGLEVHAPFSLNSGWADGYLEMIHRTGTKWNAYPMYDFAHNTDVGGTMDPKPTALDAYLKANGGSAK